MTPLLYTFEPAHPLHEPLRIGLKAESGQLSRRRFPDGESYLRVEDDVSHRHTIILADLSYPDDKFLPLSFLCDLLRDLGAASVGLVAPYLSYMRQDSRFQPGEALTSRSFAQLLSRQMDWLVTVDPHLHRYHDLAEIYSIPTSVTHAAPLLAQWLAAQGEQLLLVGPDAESEQWVAQIAGKSGHPYVVGEKRRLGDRSVTLTLPELSVYRDRAAVIVDDVISSGQTILRCIEALRGTGIQQINCAAIHALMEDGVERSLRTAGLQQLVTTNTLAHPSNGIDVSGVLLPAINAVMASS